MSGGLNRGANRSTGTIVASNQLKNTSANNLGTSGILAAFETGIWITGNVIDGFESRGSGLWSAAFH